MARLPHSKNWCTCGVGSWIRRKWNVRSAVLEKAEFFEDFLWSQVVSVSSFHRFYICDTPELGFLCIQGILALLLGTFFWCRKKRLSLSLHKVLHHKHPFSSSTTEACYRMFVFSKALRCCSLKALTFVLSRTSSYRLHGERLEHVAMSDVNKDVAHWLEPPRDSGAVHLDCSDRCSVWCFRRGLWRQQSKPREERRLWQCRLIKELRN